MIRPVITPKGRRFPPAADDDSTIGSIGRMQGESTVTIPDTNANANRMAIYLVLSLLHTYYNEGNYLQVFMIYMKKERSLLMKKTARLGGFGIYFLP